MRRQTVAVALVGLFLAMGAVGLPNATGKNDDRASWLLLVYLDADNNLDVYAGAQHVSIVEDDFDELMSVGSTDSVVCYVLVDRWTSYSNLFRVDPGEMVEMTDFALNGEEANMGDPATLRSFVSFATEETPAEHVLLVFWDHGSPNIVAYDDNGPEEGVPDSLTHHEVIEALEGFHVDVIAADECNVAQMEVAYEYRMCGLQTDYLVAAETYTGWRGYPYDQVFERLVDEPAMTAREAAVMMIDETQELLGKPPYMGEQVNEHGAIDLSKVDELANSLIRLSDLLKLNINSCFNAVSKARGNAVYLYGANAIDLIDLKDFVIGVSKFSRSTEIKAACEDVLAAFDDAVVALQLTQATAGKVNGLGIAFPHHPWEVTSYYETYLFPGLGWLEFLEAYWAAAGAT